MTLATDQSNGGIGLALDLREGTQSPAYGPLSEIVGVTLRGYDGYAKSNYWTKGILLSGMSNVNLTDVAITGPKPTPKYSKKGTGLEISGSKQAIPVAFNITRATINLVEIGIEIGRFVQGVTISGSNLTGNWTGVYVPQEADNSKRSMLFVNNGNQFNCMNAAINVQSKITDIQVTGNMIILPWISDQSATVGVQIGPAGPFSIVNNAFVSADGSANNLNGVVIQKYWTGAGLISGNNFSAMNPTAIFLQEESQKVNVQSNAYAVGEVVNKGKSNRIGSGSN